LFELYLGLTRNFLYLSFIGVVGRRRLLTTAKGDKGDKFADLRRPLWLIWEFVVHIAVGTFLFILIALVALLLAGFVEWLGNRHMPSLLLQAVTCLEYALFVADVIAFGLFLFVSLSELLRALWQH
jgi:hypothetical protein